MKNILSQEAVRTFRQQVYRYFVVHGRTALPWRTTYNPYHILVSEIMLQQTQVDRVIEKFSQFILRFPDLQTLADARLDTVLAQWQGLGYNRRAVALREAAKIIMHDYNGVVPEDPDKLRTLPGIGYATAASIAAFAYNKPTVFLETNIRTVFIHHFFPENDMVDDHDILVLAETTLDRRNPRKWYSALMDYGSMLKKTVGNLSRNSSRYRKQTPFIGSRRQVRGALLRWLIKNGKGTVTVIAAALNCEERTVLVLLEKLVEEGLLKKNRQHYRIAQ